jgi:hypothetical protein
MEMCFIRRLMIGFYSLTGAKHMNGQFESKVALSGKQMSLLDMNM